jgi:tRNA U34 5-carboxymethylaminomethyl modifying GTPase MnmE/TrmE
MDRTEYLNLRRKILEAYEKIHIWPEILPDEQLKLLKVQARNLREEKFIVSVCGQTKAGKSTLLNALIFQSPILPVDDTPFTSRITRIEYGLFPSCEIFFHNRADWDTLNNKNPAPGEEQNQAEFLAGEIIKSFKKGVKERDCINEQGKSIQITDLNELHEYVCYGGKFTPFVREVCLRFPADILKNAVFVDTPGINDPNPLTGKQTRDWIQQSHAVIYVCYAGRALNEVDFEFMDQCLLHVPLSQRIIAINKVDQVSDFQELQQWVQELGSTESRRGKCLFGELSTICYVCGLGGLIAACLKKQQPLSSEYEFYHQDLQDRGFLAESGNLIGHFRDCVEKRLLEQRGQITLQAHKTFIENSFHSRKSSLRHRIEHLQSKVQLLEQDHEKLKTILLISREKQKHIRENFAVFGRNLDTEITRLMRLFISRIREIRKTLLKEITEESNRIKELGRLQIEFPWIVKHSLESAHPIMKEIGRNYLTEIGKITQTHISTLENALESNTLVSRNELSELLKRSSEQTISLFVTTLQEVIEADTLSTLFKSLAPTWQRWFMPGRSLENVRLELFKMLENFFCDQFDLFGNELNRDLVVSLEKIITETAKEIHSMNESLKGEINYHLHNEQKCTGRIENEKQEIFNLKAQIIDLQNFQKSLGLNDKF